MDHNWIYSYLGRGQAYADKGDKERAKRDFDKVLSIEPTNQQAKDQLASLQVDSPTSADARFFLDVSKQFVSDLSQAPVSISQIASAAADLEIAIQGFNDLVTLQARTRLADLLVSLPSFQGFLEGRRQALNAANNERLARDLEDGLTKRACIDNYVKRDIADPKNAALTTLRVQLERAATTQSFTELETANRAASDFFQSNGISCEPPAPRFVPIDSATHEAFRVYLEDVQAFLMTQPSIDQDKVADIALFATRLREAISKSNESEAKQFEARLDELLVSVPGYYDFMGDRKTGRQHELQRRFILAEAKAEEAVYFISEFLRQNLTYPKTETLLRHRTRLENSRRPASVTDISVSELEKANDALDTFIRENSLSSDYKRIVPTFGRPPEGGPRLKPGLPITPKTEVALVGPDEDMVFLYNPAPSAPSITKDIAGKLVFLTDVASICFAQNRTLQDRLWFVEQTLEQDGAKEVKGDASFCDFSKVPTAVDIVVFQRGELRKQQEDHVLGLLDLLQNDGLRRYKVVSAADYEAYVALQIARDVEAGNRTGFGVMIVSDGGSPACIVAGNHVTEVGLSELLQRKKEFISRNLRFEWDIVNMSVSAAFEGLTRQQCGYAAGDTDTLRGLKDALYRDDRKYEFAPIWFSTEDVNAAGTEEIRRRDAVEKGIAEQNNIGTAARKQREAQKQAIEERLRSENGPRARALKDEVDGVVRVDAFVPLTDKPRVASATQRLFPGFASWLNRQFDGQWETTEVASEIADYGKVQWNGRTLDGIIVQINVTQKNRIQGIYATTCFIFGQVVDDEFAMRRDVFSVPCSGSRPMLDDWRTRRELRSLWNAPEFAAIGTSP